MVPLISGAEARVVPVRERTESGMCGQVRTEPLFLDRSCPDAGAAVEDHDVPGTQVITVVAFRGVSSGRAEVRAVPGGAGGKVVVITRSASGACLVAAPRGVITPSGLIGGP